MKRIALFFLAVSMGLVSSQVFAEDITIEGVYIGMDKAAYDALNINKDFTITGFHEKYDLPSAKFENGKLVNWIFFFYTNNNFTPIHEAFQNKYPDLKCTPGATQNNMEASSEQIGCVFIDKDTRLEISRFVSDLETGCISMHSVSYVEAKAKKHKKKTKCNI